MKLTEQEVRNVANLANLSLTDDEVTRMAQNLDGILTQMERLAEIDTEGVEPMSQVLFAAHDESNDTATLRPDVERPPLGSEIAVASAPVTSGGYFKVPKVIER